MRKNLANVNMGRNMDSSNSKLSYSSGEGFSQPMDAEQMFKAFFGNRNDAGMHHAFHHHFGFGSNTTLIFCKSHP